MKYNNIDDYICKVKEIKASIMNISGDQYLNNHKRTLLFNLLDMLSKCIYPLERKNGFRFVQFIIEYCEWEDAQRISLQQLILLLTNNSEERYAYLKEYAIDEIRRFPSSTPVPFSYDPTINQIEKYFAKGERNIEGMPVENLRHVNLLWKLRNSLTHEMRSIGATPLFDKAIPHYIQYQTMSRNEETGEISINNKVWEICYPVEFYNQMIDKAIENVRNYLENNNLNPFDSYSFRIK
ncbi:hypothetical protein [Paenibacillus sp. LjRoot56]|uniref:hypothetical protein n=1 Tax=Paenibacillus sp. LjRoot56 TaxID=3342333 RepID=UPI003ED0A1D6